MSQGFRVSHARDVVQEWHVMSTSSLSSINRECIKAT
jgi:hypothetical protein